MYINVCRAADTDPHDFGKTYSDPYWSAKLDPDPHKKKDSGSLEAQKLSQGKPRSLKMSVEGLFTSGRKFASL
jgi:hypothetical protein